MSINTKNRSDLKSYFVKNAIPTQGQFADLIEAQLNQADDGVFKLPGEPFSVVAAAGEQKRALRLYSNYPAANPDWLISLNPAQDPANAATTRPGFGIADGAGNTRLFIDAATGRLGVGTNNPQASLDVNGDVRVGNNMGVDGVVTVNRIRGRNNLVLDSYETVNPTSNVYIDSPPNDRDAWIYRDSAGTTNNWGIYHRQIGSSVAGLPANSIGFIGGGQSKLQAYVSLGNGSAFFAGKVDVNGGMGVTGNVSINGFTTALGIAVNNSQNTGVGRGLWLWNSSNSDHVIYSASPTGKSPANNTAIGGFFDTNHRMRFRTSTSQGFLFENNAETALVDIDADDGRLWTKGAIYAGNSDLYFSRTDHNYTPIGNTVGWAAIQNAANYDALMILGRQTSSGRRVRLWDYLEVNGNLHVTSDVRALGGVRVDGNLVAHVNTDGAFYRYDGEVYITVDNHLYIRDTDNNIRMHFNTNVGEFEVIGPYIKVRGAGSERAYMGGDGSGNDVQIGSTNSSITNLAAYNPSNGYMNFYARTCNPTSDARLKEDIEPVTGGLEKLLKLRSVSFKWKDADPKEPRRRSLGLLAQEVREVLPEAVVEARTGTLALDYNAVLAVAIEALQEQQSQITELRKALNEIYGRLDTLAVSRKSPGPQS